jgi:hypothetical protein
METARRNQWIKDYPDESIPTPDVLINLSDPTAVQKMNAISRAEAEAICLKLDLMSEYSPAIALLVAECGAAIIQMVRIVKWQTKQNFRGLLAAGQALTLDWLRPIYIGGPLLNNGVVAASGIYANAIPTFAGTPPLGTGTRTWLHTGTAGTLYHMIPPQQENLYSGIVHMGAIDPIDTPKLGTITFYRDNTLVAPFALNEDVRKSWGSWDIPINRWEKPILVPPLGLQAIDVCPDLGTAADDNLKLLSILVLQAQDVVQ